MHEIAIRIGSLTIYWYGVLVASGFLIGIWTASRRAIGVSIAPEKIVDMGPWLVIGAILGARIFYVVTYWHEQFANGPPWEVLMIHHGGLVFHGGLIGAFLAGLWYVRRQHLPFWLTSDVLAPSIALGHVFGRFGCLMKGCCYGKPTDLPWAIHFPSLHETHGVGLHPTEIYEALLNLALFGALAWLFPRRKFDGQIFGAYLVGYGLLRSFVDLFRGDYTTFYFGALTPGQLVSSFVFAAGLGVLAKGFMVRNKTTG